MPDSRTPRQLGDPLDAFRVRVLHPIDGAIMHIRSIARYYLATGALTSAGSAAFAILTSEENVAASETAISASIRRSSSISASFRPWMKIGRASCRERVQI